jgi:choline dehydrogenase-like flavoprotein
MEVADVIVVGSGATGAMAAQTLVEGGARVTMLDVGRTETTYGTLIPPDDFVAIRRTDADQHRYLIGDAFEGLPKLIVTTGAQLTPPRRHVSELVEELLPVSSTDFFHQESLAYGGLGSAWGAGTCVYSDPELAEAGLDPTRMRGAYQVVADRIGISGADDDARPYTWAYLDGVEAPPALDETCSRLFARYQSKREQLRARGFRMGRTALALITHDRDGRQAYAERDMDFYSDAERSVYRPWITVDALRTDPRFTYVDGMLALRFEEGADGVEVESLDIRTGERVRHRARRIVLAAGTLGTARIVLRSTGAAGRTLPILCNPYTYVPCIQPALVGHRLRARRMSLAQLSLAHDPDGTNSDVAMGSIYSYRSLMLFRILPQVPIDTVDGRILMQYLMPALTIVGIHHPERPGPGRTLRLEADPTSPTGDRLAAEYALTAAETRRLAGREKAIIRALRSLGSWAIKRIHPGMGASIHYAGTLPFGSGDGGTTLRADGRLNGSGAVWVADGSGFRFLPAKGLTLSLMANAHLVGQAVLRDD